MLLGRNLQDGWNGRMIVLEDMSNIVGNMLIDEDNADIFTRRKVEKGLFNLLELGVLFDNQKVGSLGGAVADAGEQKARDSVL